MKTKFSIIFMWLFTILFISCDKLDLYPEDSLSPTTYFKNETNFNCIVISFTIIYCLRQQIFIKIMQMY